MCGRYSFAPTQKQLDEQLPNVEIPAHFQPRYNIAPTQLSYVITADEPNRLQAMHWGLVPFWSKDGALSGKMINARCEGIETKSAFRTAVERRRCLVPADSFYEWRTAEKRRKIPYRILRKDGQLMFLAGIWEEWGRGENRKRTFSIITTGPNADVEALHDRMPVVLTTPALQRQWLEDIPQKEVLELLRPPKDGLLELYQVSERLNAPGPDDAALHEPVEDAPTSSLLF